MAVMTDSREYLVTVYWKGNVHDLYALATTPTAALAVALKEQPKLRRAIKSGEASFNVAERRAS
jgi:hypothetical protein